MAKHIIKKFRSGIKILREFGVISLLIVMLQKLQNSFNKNPGSIVDTRAKYNDVISADPSKPANRRWKGLNHFKPLCFNWLMPPPGKGSGGHMTLFRFIKYLEDHGHKCRIYFFKPNPTSTVEDVLNVMGDSFPPVKAQMSWLKENEEMDDADGIFATSWETAYSVYASKVKAKKFYFVQDFEPYFYPVGGLSILAENTYRLGFYGITAGGWLKKKLHAEYGMTTESFDFGSDSDVYKLDNTSKRKEVVFYARPYTERRGFELGILALDIFHRKHPEYAINFIGWDTSDYKIPFPYNNLKILEHNDLNDVYNRSAAGLVMSLTNMSLLPLELLSSGCIPVVNEGSNNRLVSDNGYIAYSESDPVSLAGTLSDIVTRSDATDYAQKASHSVSKCSWDDSGSSFVKIVEIATRKPL